MYVTDGGITIEVNELQPPNAQVPIILTEVGSTTDFNSLQSQNAFVPTDATP